MDSICHSPHFKLMQEFDLEEQILGSKNYKLIFHNFLLQRIIKNYEISIFALISLRFVVHDTLNSMFTCIETV